MASISLSYQKELHRFYRNKTILITGGAGSIGSAIAKELLKYNPKVIRLLDINETGLYYLKHKLDTSKIRLFIGDVRDKDRLRRAIEGVDIVFHAAALKHVPLCEYNPFEAIKTNVIGTQNLIDVALDEEVSKFITISTDKAVNPVNVLGATKLLAEKLTIAANLYKGARRTVFSCVRFGNVLGSRGSVVMVFIDQIRRGGPITITDDSMTRFLMDISQAVYLILKAAVIAKGGEIFILKMPAIRIIDLAIVIREILAPQFGYSPNDIKIETIGKRPGEKLHEELMTVEDVKYVKDVGDMFIINSLPAMNRESRSKDLKTLPIKGFTSKDARFLSKKQIENLIKKFLQEHDLFYF